MTVRAGLLWSTEPLAKLGRVVTGRTPPTEKPELFGTEYPFLTPSDFDGARDIRGTARGISAEGARSLKGKLVPAGSLSVSCIGWQLGRVAMVGRDSFTNQQINTIVPNDAIVPRFLYYHLLTRRDEIRALASVGTRTPILNKTRFEQLQIPVPPQAAQRKIASILSAFDDLIENNNCRIKILEEMAQRIYREWFVDFRFPGHEGVPLVDSELGPIPEGWGVVGLADVVTQITRGVSPKYAENSEQVVINQKCVRGGKLNLGPARRHVTNVPKAKSVMLGDILINSTGEGTLGRVAQVLKNLTATTVDSHVTIARPNSLVVTTDYLGVNLLGRESEFAAMAAGSTGQTELNRSRIGDLPIVLPLPDIQARFTDIVAPIRQLPVTLGESSHRLAHARDLLIPRLVSGEIDVEHLDLPVDEAAA